MAEESNETVSESILHAVKAKDIPFANDGIDSQTIYVDVIRGAVIVGDVAKINLVEHRADVISGSLKAVIVATIVVPKSQLKNWGDFFHKLARRASGNTPDAK